MTAFRLPWLSRVCSRERLPFVIAMLLLAAYLLALATGEYSRR